MREAGERGEALGLNEDEFAFYEALDANGDVASVMGDAQLAVIARELVERCARSATIDWTLRESVRAQMRVLVKRILKKYGYPPDLAEGAVATVLEQAEALTGGVDEMTKRTWGSRETSDAATAAAAVAVSALG